MKQFNLKEYLENPDRKVVTRDGKPVRIICTDKKGSGLSIIALVDITEAQEEQIILYNSDGRGAYLNEKWDIFFADEAVLDKTETDTTKKDDTEECCSEEYREQYNLSESEKNKIVSGKFLYALTNFSLFKKWETYWLEYVGDDTYIGRSDNILNEKVVITPYQLDNYFSESALSDFENILSEWFYGMRTWGFTADEETCENFCDSQAHKAAKHLLHALMRNYDDMTIEERADAYVGHPEEIDEFTSETIKRDAYIRGAKEQKAIDIDNACIILCRYACPYKIDSNKCWNTVCDTWEKFRRMMEK